MIVDCLVNGCGFDKHFTASDFRFFWDVFEEFFILYKGHDKIFGTSRPITDDILRDF